MDYLRNFWNVLTRFRLVSALNLIGLSVAFATFTIIMIQVRWEYSYGKSDTAADSIYRFDELDKASGKFSTTLNMDLGRAFSQSSPLIVESAGMQYSTRNFKALSQDIQNPFFNDIPTIYTNDNIFKVFDITLLQGTVTEFMMPNKAIVSESIAAKMFGDKNPIGQAIKDQWRDEVQISGVYKELPSNATVPNGVIIFEEFRNVRMNTHYVKISDRSKIDQIIDNFTKEDRQIGHVNPSKEIYRLINVGDIYFDKGSRPNSFIKQGNKTTTDILFFVGILVVLIAMINFVNFYMALAPRRVKGLNARLVFGASRNLLRVRLVSEAVGISIVAFWASLFWIDVFNSTSLSSVMKMGSVGILANWQTVLLCGLLAVIEGSIAGLFPAKYCTSFEPALALKGGVMSTRKGKKLRATLVGFQYVISIVLIVFALFVGLQHKAMVNAPLGYDQENLFTVKMSGNEKAQQFCDKLAGESFVVSAAKYNGAFGTYEGDMLGDVVSVYGDTIKLCSYMVSHNFLDVIGIPIIEGDGFKPDAVDLWDDLDNGHPWDVVVNQATMALFGGEVGHLFKNSKHAGKILGVTGDFVSKSVALNQDPVAFVVVKDTRQVLIRTQKGSNAWESLEKLNTIVKEIETENTPQVSFYSEHVAKLYDNEKQFGLLISLFSLVAIIISLVGVFGIVAFETQNRRKEIGIRKVFGATINQVLEMFNVKFILLVGVSCVIALPIAYWGVSQWLEGFVYKTPIVWWVFVVAGFTVALVTVITVTIQSYRSATENPVKAISNE